MTPNDGSISADELLAEAGFLQRLARGLAADEHAAADLAQETLVTALERPPRSAGPLRGWLATVAANLARNARRSTRRRDQRERAAAREERIEVSEGVEPSLERLELQRALFELVLALPAEQRTVLYLRYYEGQTPGEIARHLGESEKTVKSRQTRALAALRERLDARSGGDRRVWLEALVPLSIPRPSGWAGGAVQAALGGLAMKKLVVAGVAVIVALSAWLAVTRGPLRERWAASREGGAHVTFTELRTQPAALAPALAPEALPARQPLRQPSAVATGALALTFHRADGTPAADVPVVVECLANPAPRIETVRARTDATGTATFEALFAGAARLWAGEDRFDAEVEAGTTRALEFTLTALLTVEGQVVDTTGAPVAAAEIWGGRSDERWPGGFLLATSASDGSFRVRDMDWSTALGARKKGYVPSQCLRPNDMSAETTGLYRARFVLERGGGGVRGRVLDPEGNPLAHAGVLAGPEGGWVSGATVGVAPEAAFAETEAQGAFELPNDLPPGKHPIHASAHGYPVWRGEVEVVAGRTSELEIRLERGARIEGRLLGLDGAPVAVVKVLASEEDRGGWYHDRFAPSECVSDEQGLFTLDWLAPGRRELNASDYERPELGRARASVTCVAGETATCELRLERGNTIAGTVVDEAGAPLVGWSVGAETSGMSQWYPRRARTDAAGRFELLNLGDGNHDVVVRAPEFGPPRATANGVPVGTRELALVVNGAHAALGTLRGRVLDPTAPTLEDLDVTLWQVGGREGHFLELDAASGVVRGSTPPGHYTLCIARSRHELHRSEEFEVTASAETDLGDIALGALGAVEVTLTTSGFPASELQRLRLSLERVGASSASLRFADGRWRAEDVLPGAWTVTLGEDELFLRGAEIEVAAGERAEVEVAVELAIPVHFVYTDPAASWVTLEARDGAGKLLRSERVRPVPRDGRSQIHLGLPAGHAKLELRTDDGRKATLELDVTEELRGSEPIEVELR